MVDQVDPAVVQGNTPMKISEKPMEKAEKSISWADDGKSSNLIALAEVTLEVRPYYSPWGDVQAKWNEVARILGDRKAIPSGKNFRAVQGKMKDLLDTLSRYQEDSKKQAGVPRCPFSEKLFRLLLQVQDQTTSTPAPRQSRKRGDVELRRSSPGDEEVERKFISSEKRRRALEDKWEMAYQEKEAELRRLKEEALRYEYMRRDLEAKMKADDDRRVNEQKVEAATLQMLRQVFSDVEKLRSRDNVLYSPGAQGTEAALGATVK